jgi:hypothetical protein
MSEKCPAKHPAGWVCDLEEGHQDDHLDEKMSEWWTDEDAAQADGRG